MSKIRYNFIKMPSSILVPADDEAREAIQRLRNGCLVGLDIAARRNPKFHRKFMALVKVGFDAFEPEQKDYKGMPAQKNFERFRKDVTIAAGFYEATYDLHGNVKLSARSLSWALMDEVEFEKVYSAVINVLLQKILAGYTREDIDYWVDQILRFD